MKCISCDSMVDDHRLHLGYNECIECSDEEKYSAHQVYPHKTGGYVQPVKSDTKKNLQRMVVVLPKVFSQTKVGIGG